LEPWFERMAAVPGIQFSGSPGIDRSTLPGAGLRPVAETGYFYWPTPDGSTTASPASRRMDTDTPRSNREEIVKTALEAIELPGFARDYHFILQGAAELLWSQRRKDPAGLRDVEMLAFADLALLEAVPHISWRDDNDPSSGFLHVPSVERLLTLLEREGALREALTLSRRVQRFGVSFRREQLEAKVTALDEELR
jgi:hypothetical protein